MIHHMNWIWLEQFAMDHSIAALSSSAKPIHWAELIAFNIHCHLTSNQATRASVLTIHPPRELLSTISDSTPYDYTHKTTSRLPKKDEEAVYVAERLVEIIGHWLGYPQDITSRPKAWFIGHLIYSIGPSVLLLPTVWQAFNAFKTHVLGNKKIGLIRPRHLVPFRQQLAHHPIVDTCSPLRDTLRRISTLFIEFRSGFARREVMVVIPMVSRKRKAIDQSLPAQPASKRTRSEPNTLGASGQQTLLDMILDVYPTIDNPGASVLPKHTRVRTDPDAYSPFRERAPSRKAVLQPSGPFEERFIKTTDGLLSALIWRGITFGTQFVLEEDTSSRFYLNNLQWLRDQFNYHRTRDPSYCCKSTAYTTPITGRSTDLLEDFVTAVSDPTVQAQWHSLTHSSTTTYSDLFHFFTGSKPKGSALANDQIPIRPGRSKQQLPPYRETKTLFPTIGALLGHLLASDVHYALYNHSPSVEDMAVGITRLKMGAAKGMMKLGLIRQCEVEQLTEGEVSKAFIDAYNFIDSRLTEEQKEKMGWDAGMLEHAMCKYSKMNPKQPKKRNKQTSNKSKQRSGRNKKVSSDEDDNEDGSDI